MNNFNILNLSTLLCLPAPDVKALGMGRSICAISALFIRPGQKFLLCPTEIIDDDSYVDNCYRLEFQSQAKVAFESLEYDLPEIEYWANCKKCTIVDSPDKVTAIESLSVWKKDWLAAKIKADGKIFLTTLRTYKLVSSFTLPGEIIYQEKIGKFLSLGCESKVNAVHILEDLVFNRRKEQLDKFIPSAYPALELLQSQVAELAIDNPLANLLNYDIQAFLEWQAPKQISQLDCDWIDRINPVGNSSDGNEFEKLVRRSFIYLGFGNSLNNTRASLNPETTGGAGGIDIYCNSPFSLVGECKASKNESVPNSVSAQLIHLGNTHLGKDTFDRSVKVIFAAGKLTRDAQQAATQNHINIMTPATLQRLVTFKSQYPGAVNLHELEKCLRQESFGQAADTKVNHFIDRLAQDISIRSHIVNIFKNYLDSQQVLELGIEQFYIVYSLSAPLRKYSERELHEVLIELSSPLSGYLARNKGEDWKADRFYFLRSL
jgi:hypothetical protein